MTTEHPLIRNEFESIECELPGSWWSDGDQTICIQTKWRPVDDRRHFRAMVYDGPAATVGLDTPRVATATHSSQALAVREALAEASVLGGVTDE